MESTVQKWGNSLGLRIPKAFAVDSGIEEGSTVEITLEGDRIVIAAVRRRPALDELLARVTPKTRHDEVDWSDAVGREGW